jgi:hypothetical protein
MSSVRQPQGARGAGQPVMAGGNKCDGKTVANILAMRGVTVTPTVTPSLVQIPGLPGSWATDEP